MSTKILHGNDPFVYRRRPNKLQTQLDGEMVILDMETDKYCGLNEIGMLIWEELSEPRSYDMLREQIMARYDIDHDTCTADMNRFLDDMVKNNLVEVFDSQETK